MKANYEMKMEQHERYYRVIFTPDTNYGNISTIVYSRKEAYANNFNDEITNVKKPAYLIIDDRCINFNGDYEDLLIKIETFKVWYK